MKVLIFSDIHGDLRALHKIVQQSADIYYCRGRSGHFQPRAWKAAARY